MIKNKQVTFETFQMLDRLPRLFREFGSIEFAYLFGGLAKGSFSPLSDIDIAVYFQDGTDVSKETLALLGELNDFLRTDEIDLVALNTAQVSLVGRILMQKKLLFCRNDFLRHSFESLCFRKFFDFRILETQIFSRRYRVG